MFLKLSDRYGTSNLYNMSAIDRIKVSEDGGSNLYFERSGLGAIHVKETVDQIYQMLHDYEYEKAQLYKGE